VPTSYSIFQILKPYMMNTKKSLALTNSQKTKSVLQSILSIAFMGTPSAVALSTLLLPLIAAPAAHAMPLPKDWCGRLWGIDNTTIATVSPTPGNPATLANSYDSNRMRTVTYPQQSIIWDNPITGASNSPSPPNVGAIPPLPSWTAPPYVSASTTNSSTGVITLYSTTLVNGPAAALAIHARSGTLYVFDRYNRTLYRYNMSSGTGWTPTVLTQIPILLNGFNTSVSPPVAYTSAQLAAINFNKMTVTGDKLIIASSDSLQTFTYDITPTTGALASTTGLAAAYTWAGSTPGGNPNVNTRAIGGGDITQDEYGDTYNITYDNLSTTTTPVASTTEVQYVYFYKQVGTTWEYRGRTPKVTPTDSFAGAAFYADTFFVKGTAGQLFKLPVTRLPAPSTEYDWSGLSLSSVGGTGTGITDLGSCGVPAISVSKTQSIYSDEAATMLTTDPTKITTGQYIKYTIVVTNFGDAWARDSYLKDTLPNGVTYVPNSATENGVNLNAATYPFDNFAATASGSPTGQIRLLFNGNTNTATYTYLVRVTGTAPSVANQVQVGYLNPYPSDPPNCATGLNCGTSPTVSLSPSIFGTVWNDKNGSANQTFSNIFTTGEAGTNTGTANALHALLVNSAGNVLATKPVDSDGKYEFLGLSENQTGLSIRLSTAAGTVNSAAPTAAIPVGWKGTSPKTIPAFNLGTVDLNNRDFGVSLPAGLVLVKRITGIKPVGATTWNRTANPHDGTPLNTVVTSPSDTAGNATNPNWPSGYVLGAHNAGQIRPGDELEYTIYYLNTKGADTKNLKICDPIRGKQSYTLGSMQLQPGGSSTTITLTDAVNLGIDRANNYGAGAAPTDCNAGSTTATGVDRGGVVVQITGTGSSTQPDLSVIPSAIATADPAGAYGWFRFTTKVDP
jgi:uncharacterized repeat protein (TIGR01451 family)